MNSISTSIKNEKIINKIFLDINDLIWKYALQLKDELSDPWNIIFLLHHEFVLELSHKIGPLYDYPSCDECQIKNRFNSNTKISNVFICNRGYHFNSRFSRRFFQCIEFIASILCSKKFDKLIYLSRDPELERNYVDKLCRAVNQYLNSLHLPVSIASGHFLSHIVVRKLRPLSFCLAPRILFTGSRVNIFTRSLAVNTMKTQGIVISSTHGGRANSSMNEPIFNYSELTACTILFEYGSVDSPLTVDPEYKPKIIMRKSCPSVLLLSQIKSELSSYSEVVYYIPTLLSGDFYYFPYRQLPDHVYVNHWDRLLSADESIRICLHPKNKVSSNADLLRFFYAKWKHRICTSKFYHLLENSSSKYFMIDYHSTVSAELIGANKAIYFLDIELRRANQKYLDLFKKYVYYQNASCNNFDYKDLDMHRFKRFYHDNADSIGKYRNDLLKYSIKGLS